MAVINWRDSFNTGITQFDKEHHKLVELINSMFLAVKERHQQSEVESHLAELLEYTQYHFANEEQAMEEAGYPDLEKHRQEHQKLKEDALRYQADLEADVFETTRGLYVFLREWLTNHIVSSDKHYASHIAPDWSNE